MAVPILKPQEIPFDSPESCNYFIPSSAKPLVAAPAAVETHGDSIGTCLAKLQALAQVHHGLDYLQVFDSPDREALWFIENGEGDAITALLPSDY